MDIAFFIVFSVVSIIMVIIAVIAFRQGSGTNDSLAELSELLGGEKSYGSYSTFLDGAPLDYGLYSQGSGNSRRTYFMMRHKVAAGFDFQVNLEGGFDGFAKKFGLTTEVQSNDPQFDDRFYLSSPNTEAMRLLVEKSECRQQIGKFFDSKIMQLSCHRNEIVLKSSTSLLSELSAENVKAIALELIAFGKQVQAVASQMPPTLERQQSPFQRYLPLTLMIGGSTLGFIVLCWGMVKYPPLDILDVFLQSLSWSIPLFLVCAYLLKSMLAGRSDGHKVLAIGMAFFLPGVGGFGHGALAVYNGYYDKSQPVPHVQTIDRVDFSKSDDSTSYYAYVYSWREGHDIEKIKITYLDYRKLKKKKGAKLEITTRSGALDYEWLVSYRRVGA